MSVYTRTYTHVKTRLESIEDQFAHFLQHGGINDATADEIVNAVHEQAIEAVGLYITGIGGRRIAEAELRVDWSRHGSLVLVQPTINIDVSGWSGTQSPEVKIAGRRFAKLAQDLRSPVQYWVQFTQAVHDDRARYLNLCSQVGVVAYSSLPAWQSEPIDRIDPLLDLPEATIAIRRARGK